jgi:hypothetical protein
MLNLTPLIFTLIEIKLSCVLLPEFRQNYGLARKYGHFQSKLNFGSKSLRLSLGYCHHDTT